LVLLLLLLLRVGRLGFVNGREERGS